ncbi:MAG: translation initiation factor IF-3 [Lentisphaerae bacterium]|nr:translation initiation factor IF-3 [Lentisphaerota bacterium]
MRKFIRVNHKIRVPQVRCVGAAGEQVGIISTSDALRLAQAAGLDLVEIAPNAEPPVCRILDYGKYQYEEHQREKLARKRQGSTVLKEMKFHSNVEEHDYQTKLRHILEFLEKGHRVKATLVFRGRENEHRDLGYAVFNRLIKDCEVQGISESPPRLFGHMLVLMFRPQQSKQDKKPAGKPEAAAS